jgi:signal transduction histidine kinase
MCKSPFLVILCLLVFSSISISQEKEIKRLIDSYDSLIVDDPVQLSINLHSARKKSWRTLDDSIIAEVNIQLANFYRRTGELDEGIRTLNSLDSLSFPTQLITKKLTELGALYYEKGLFKKSINQYLKALKIYSEISDSINIAATYNNIGIVYDDIEDYNSSNNYYRKAKAIFVQHLDSAKMAVAYNNIGSSYYMQEKYDSALIAFHTSLAIRKELNKPQLIVSSINNIGLTYITIGVKDSAEVYMKQGVEIAEKFKMPKNLCHAYSGYGDFFKDQKEYKKALYYLEKALRISEKNEYRKLKESLHSNLSDVYEKLGDHNKALAHYKLMHETEQELKLIASKEEVLKLQTKFALKEQKDKFALEAADSRQEFDSEISQSNTLKNIYLLFVVVAVSLVVLFVIMLMLNIKKKRQILREAKASVTRNEELSRLIVTKDTFISLLAHDLKSPLIAQNSFNNLLIANENNQILSNDEIKQFALESQLNVNHVLELMDNLLKWAQSSTKKLSLEFERIKMSQVIQKAVKIHSEAITNKNLEVTLFSHDPKVFIDSNTMQTVFRNLLSNAIKFTPDNGSISFEYKADANRHVYLIQDSGEGISDEISKKLFSKELQDFSNVNSSGLGLLICKNFIEKNKGTIKHVPTSKGTCFSISIPK